ncbi:MAG: aminoacyl-tRNA hydrolase [Deltaproteobacteria bacterium]|nr:aminoacyl-tRNA hydrolase [Deltaproteobacteria bacterium]
MRPVKLIAGLGNPGDAYSLTRHNIGFMAADRIAKETGIALNTMKFHSLLGHGTWCEQGVIIAKPQTFMNRSGEAISALAESFCIAAEDIIVIHDDMDVAFGSIKIKVRGGSAGHRGIASLIDQLCTDAFVRLRIGIGRPPSDDILGQDYVLEPFSTQELNQLDLLTAKVHECLEMLLTQGVAAAMNRFHTAATDAAKHDSSSEDTGF